MSQVFGDQVSVELIAGSGGVFEVNGDGELLFSKMNLGRFPEMGEVVAAVKKKL